MNTPRTRIPPEVLALEVEGRRVPRGPLRDLLDRRVTLIAFVRHLG
jgi:hypothetical protein